VAFYSLTISPFLVIDDKCVEVFNGDKICEGIGRSLRFQDDRRAPPEDTHMRILLLNANAYGRFELWRSPPVSWNPFNMHHMI
jgi:hypothetical protein